MSPREELDAIAGKFERDAKSAETDQLKELITTNALLVHVIALVASDDEVLKFLNELKTQFPKIMPS